MGFQLIGALHPRLRTADLPRQTLNKRGQNIEVRVGRPVAAKAVKSFASEREATEYLRFRTFLLAGRGDAPPVPKKRLRPLAPATLAELIAAETGCLAPVCENEDFAVYLARADEIPNTLREIGRLRELTFRGAGEERHSTWTASIRTICTCSCGARRRTRWPALTGWAPPRSCCCCGRALRAMSRRTRNARLVKPRHPYRQGHLAKPGPHWHAQAVSRFSRDVEELSAPIAGLERDGKGVPILIKQYMKAGGRVLGFNIDPGFSNVLDVLMMADLRCAAQPILERYMGREAAAAFLAR